MFSRFMPTEGKLFEYFNQHAECAVKAAHTLKELVNDLPNTEMYARSVQNFEKRAGRVTHGTIELLHKIFITPLDRDEIHKLIATMGDILDLMEDVSLTISLYDVINMTDKTHQFATICVACYGEVRKVVTLFNDMNNGRQILTIVHEIDRLESDTNRVTYAAVAKLSRIENDIKLLIRLKTTYEQLESVTDRCEDVASIVEDIILENA